MDEKQSAGIFDRNGSNVSIVFFYILFLPDTWQVIVGIAAAYFILPAILKPDMVTGAIVMLYIMCAVIGYALFAKPGK